MRRPPIKKKKLPLLTPSQAEWQIAQLVPGGDGFVRLASGQGAFVSGALPGERVLVSEAEDHGSYLRAVRFRLVERSPERIEPPCSVQDRCGGCDWMTLNYSAQLSAKADLLRDALTRVGRFQAPLELTIVAAPEPLGYRSRIRLHVVNGRLGFFALGSHELVEIPSCLVAHPELNTALGVLREVAREHPTELAAVSEMELRVAPGGPRVSLHLTAKADASGDVARSLSALTESFRTRSGERAALADDQRFPLGEGIELLAPAAAFTQVNWEVNQRLVQSLVFGAAEREVATFCDLYCGAGNFSLPLFARGLRGYAIEASKIAIAAAERAAMQQHISARFIAGDVRSVLAGLPTRERFDLVVLDPPRSGAREIVSQLVQRAPRYIAYCACDPVTLARDLRTLCDANYQLESVMGFDMFPQTHHFETLAWLRHQ